MLCSILALGGKILWETQPLCWRTTSHTVSTRPLSHAPWAAWCAQAACRSRSMETARAHCTAHRRPVPRGGRLCMRRARKWTTPLIGALRPSSHKAIPSTCCNPQHMLDRQPHALTSMDFTHQCSAQTAGTWITETSDSSRPRLSRTQKNVPLCAGRGQNAGVSTLIRSHQRRDLASCSTQWAYVALMTNSVRTLKWVVWTGHCTSNTERCRPRSPTGKSTRNLRVRVVGRYTILPHLQINGVVSRRSSCTVLTRRYRACVLCAACSSMCAMDMRSGLMNQGSAKKEQKN